MDILNQKFYFSPSRTGITISLYCKKPGLYGGSKRHILVSSDSTKFDFVAAARSSRTFFADSSAVAVPRNEAAMQVCVPSSRKTTCESLGCGKWPNVLPDGITKETYHSLDSIFDSRCVAITGAVIAIFCDVALPFDMYRKREPNAALDAVEYLAETFTSAITQGWYSRTSKSLRVSRTRNSCRCVMV